MTDEATPTQQAAPSTTIDIRGKDGGEMTIKLSGNTVRSILDGILGKNDSTHQR